MDRYLNRVRYAATLYFFTMMAAIPILYLIKGKISMFFTLRIFPGFLLATILIAATSFTLYALYALNERLPKKFQKWIPAFWVVIPLIAIATYMQIAFQTIFGRMHGFGYIHGLGDARSIWLILSGISGLCSVITYCFIIRNKRLQTMRRTS